VMSDEIALWNRIGVLKDKPPPSPGKGWGGVGWGGEGGCPNLYGTVGVRRRGSRSPRLDPHVPAPNYVSVATTRAIHVSHGFG
jgi:hypothetical protein